VECVNNPLDFVKNSTKLIDFRAIVLTIPPRGRTASGHSPRYTGVKSDLRPRLEELVMPDGAPPDPREMGIYLTLAQVGLEMVAPLIAGLVIDYFAGWGPWATLGGMLLGFVGGITHIVVLSNKQEAAMRNKKPPGDNLP
jgi:hypothetical protein